MIVTYKLDKKPTFTDHQMVDVDMSHFGMKDCILKGKVVGKSFEHIIDMWLIEFERDFAPTYPFKVFAVPHTAIVHYWL